ncbi:MAG: DUF427 domain-containing protein [Micromonosporaceae bacterium]|nr:DUF427 domain-containing protein [Micromonosporaceae bacterium]
MTLTLDHGPLSGDPPETSNYTVEGPAHRLLMHRFPRRVRAVFAGETVIDTRRGELLHETGLLPQLYVPDEDLRADLLEPTDRSTHCPFKGDASYWSVRVGDRVAGNAVWAYQEPLADAEWLRGHKAVYWDRMDAWFDEDEEVQGHLRDPYHRVDVRHASRRVRVLLDGATVAEAESVRLLSETGLPNRYYIARADVREELLEPSDTRTVCPYKGTARYWSLRVDGRVIQDVAWSYPEPLENALKVRDDLCFSHADIALEVDGRPVD